MTETEDFTTLGELIEHYYDPELNKLICDYMDGKQVLKAYVTLSRIIGACIARSATSQGSAQSIMDLCGAIVADVACTLHNDDLRKQEEAGGDVPTARLQ